MGKRKEPVSSARPGFPQPRPTPATIQEIADPGLRQRATDAWRAASLLRRLMEQWERWSWQLLNTGDADPGFALRLAEGVAVCVRALCNLQVNMVTFKQVTAKELLKRFPYSPGPTLQPPWQEDPAYRRQIHEKIASADWAPLMGELLGFLQLLETAPSVALPNQAPSTKNDLGGMERSSTFAAAGNESKPVEYLLNWSAILGCLGQKNAEDSRRRIRRLNEEFAGPIILPRPGGQPKVDKSTLLEWWNSLKDRFQDGNLEDQQKHADADATVQNQYGFGKEGTAVPDISGHVKKRRKNTSQKG